MKLVDWCRPSLIVDTEVWMQGDSMRHSVTLIPNFCLDLPFGFSVHRDTHFCPSRLFRFSTCRVYRFFSFHPLFLPEPFWFAGKPLFLPRYVNLAGLLFMRSIFLLCLHWRGEEGRHHPWWLESRLLLRRHV